MAMEPDKPRADEDHRIARMDASRPFAPSIRTFMAKRLGRNPTYGRKRPERKASGGKPADQGQPRSFQRVIVKVWASRHNPGKARSSLARHISYLQRPEANITGEHGVFFGAEKEVTLDDAVALKWAEDRHHFQVIISPEQTPLSLEKLTRRIMERAEKDLKTPLEWYGIAHHNTDNRHTHVLIRGVREDGRDLVIPPRYLREEFRRHAQEIATQMMGPPEAEVSLGANLRRIPGWTDLDQMLVDRSFERDGSRWVDVHPDRFHRPEDRTDALGRLGYLDRLGLARHGPGTLWEIDRELEPRLQGIDAYQTVWTELENALGTEVRRMRWIEPRALSAHPELGVVIAGSEENRWFVAELFAGHFALAKVDKEMPRIGSVVQMEGGDRYQAVSRDPLEAQIRSEGMTWLDERLAQRQPEQQGRIAEAMEKRAAHLLERGLAQRRSDGSMVLTGEYLQRLQERREGRRLERSRQQDLELDL